MFLVGMISWWYGAGYKGQFNRVRYRLLSTAGFFSIGQLFKTFFSPFRQISAERVDGSIMVVVRAFFDQLISRIIGSIVRFFTIIFGIIAIVFQSVYELIILIVWLFLPLFPVVGVIMFAIGWVPKWM
ncbi:MAG: hypothetical protein ABIP50_01655 [Candidatus Saccharimonadales bacterium]